MLCFVSALLLVWCSWRVGARLSALPAERFWIGIATALLQLGTIAELLSVVRELRPAGWMVGQILIAMLILLGTGGWRSLRLQRGTKRWKYIASDLRMVTASLSSWGLALLLICIATCALSAVTQIATPIHSGDEMRYHASRVVYWMQHQSVFPFVTHNDRQTVTPFGSELLFLWPVLLTKTEIAGRFVFWLAYPLAAIGQYLLLRAMRLNRSIALAGVVILLETPIVAASAIGLKPELWSVVTLLGVAYWVVSLCLDQERTAMKCFFLGTFTMLGVNMRGFPVALAPGVILVVFWSRSLMAPGRRMKALAGGLACGALLSGLMIPVGFNLALYGHPLGPAAARHVVTADLSPRQLYTHAVRFSFLLAEPPDMPLAAGARAQVEKLANRLIALARAATPLKFEDSGGPWPGRFTYSLTGRAQRFSTWGWFWIPALGLGLSGLARSLVSKWPRVTLAPIPALSLLAVPLLLSVLFVTRWMEQSDVPGRYLIGPYVLALPIGIGLFAHLGGRRLADTLAGMLVASSIYQPIRLQLTNAVTSIVARVSEADIDGPFEEALGAIPGGSRILFVGQQGSPDYALFAPARHYANAVFPWGKTAFDSTRMRGLIAANHVTHVLIEDDTLLRFVWDPDVDTREMVDWLGRQPRLQEISLNAPHLRLFEAGDRPAVNVHALQTTRAPLSAPLITVDQTLQDEVGIDASSLKAPWPVEMPAGADGGVLWIGQGDVEGAEFALWSRQDRAVDLQLTVSPGPGLASAARTVALLADGELAGAEQTFHDQTVVTFAVVLHAGRNALRFFALDAATVTNLPHGDARRLIVGLHRVLVTSSSVHTRPHPLPGGDDLSGSARRAAALIARRQIPPGYWLTTYTKAARFEHPGQKMNAFTAAYSTGVILGRQEMNTFTAAIMTDMLSPVATASGLGGSVNAARQFLTSQIEADGLVRYHGRPDGPTIGALGCVITPDADDTALVWRIAPDPRLQLRSTALATLQRYRTADGLYRTWLAPRDHYQCIDPGADPDPADAVIQMHVLMMLAEADPPAAVALCRALGEAIDQDRIWVYYRQAPLLPLLRRTDVRAAGCDLPLPPSRVGAAVTGQELWMAAAGLLSRVLGAAGAPPTSAEVHDLLRQLAREDFAFVQNTPPLLYHNDLTASVRRFYWSEEFGYALWLRLWFESERHGLVSR